MMDIDWALTSIHKYFIEQSNQWTCYGHTMSPSENHGVNPGYWQAHQYKHILRKLRAEESSKDLKRRKCWDLISNMISYLTNLQSGIVAEGSGAGECKEVKRPG